METLSSELRNHFRSAEIRGMVRASMHASPPNVVVLHPGLPPLTPRDRARLDLIDLYRELDPASREVLAGIVAAGLRRVRPFTRAARVLRGSVVWRRGRGCQSLVWPTSRGWLYRHAHA